MRRMNNMMNSMMGDFFSPPFGNMLSLRGTEMVEPYPRQTHEVARRVQDFGMGLMPMGFGFPNIGAMFSNVANSDNCHSFSSSAVMTMVNGPDGRPQVYQASTSSRKAPGGICETKKTVADSRTGVKKMSIGHHIGERAHVMERQQNMFSGEQEQNEEYINLDEG
ncbi:hypothetical protein AAG570_006283 [Ranatra chinensis]|uniref:Myeloid leukemia factor n=1 Tax=Ranatra chinensis TaxID=642074 RepID=A0ABD0Z6C5_9HEMI